MTRQAAPPAQRWLLLFVVLLVAPWLGQGVAVRGRSIGVDPQSGRTGHHRQRHAHGLPRRVHRALRRRGGGGRRGTARTPRLSFTVPESAPVGDHEIRAVGQSGRRRRRPRHGGARSTSPAATAATSTRRATDPRRRAGSRRPLGRPPHGGERHRRARRRYHGAGVGAGPAGSPPVPAPAGGPDALRPAAHPRQAGGIGLGRRRRGARSARAPRSAPCWCSSTAKPVAGQPPEAGTPGFFRIDHPRRRPSRPPPGHPGGRRRRVGRAVRPLDVRGRSAAEPPPSRSSPGWSPAGVLLLLTVVLLVRRRRRRRRRWPAATDRARRRPRGRRRRPVGRDASTCPTSPGRWPTPSPRADATLAAVVADDDPTMPVVPLVVASGRDGSYYLLERQNANAPRTGNGKRGWYRTHRPGRSGASCVQTVEPHTAGAAASELATGRDAGVGPRGRRRRRRPRAAPRRHRRPPPTRARRCRPRHAPRRLRRRPRRPTRSILGHAATWSAAKMREHGIPARRVSPEEFQAGGSRPRCPTTPTSPGTGCGPWSSRPPAWST